jgi:transketolase
MANKSLTIEELQKKATEIRIDLIKMLEEAGSGHSAGPLGLADIFTALYFNVLKHDPKNPDWEDRDMLLQSNGHCVPIRYTTMAHAGYFPKKELMTLRKFGSRLQGHPERERLPGLETTSGPLGCGLSQAAGIALAMRMDKINHRWVYVVMGDGELDEGNIWEAAMLVGKYKLNNIIGIIDRNNIQIDGVTEHVMPLEDLRGKWEAFGTVLRQTMSKLKKLSRKFERCKVKSGASTNERREFSQPSQGLRANPQRFWPWAA